MTTAQMKLNFIKNAAFIFDHYKFTKKCLLALIRTSGKSSALFLITRKKVLDKSVSMGYNESIKNGIDN